MSRSSHHRGLRPHQPGGGSCQEDSTGPAAGGRSLSASGAAAVACEGAADAGTWRHAQSPRYRTKGVLR